ncbi:hypothetical protein MTO96_011704 [Rhipicephalus appendiculatus]
MQLLQVTCTRLYVYCVVTLSLLYACSAAHDGPRHKKSNKARHNENEGWTVQIVNDTLRLMKLAEVLHNSPHHIRVRLLEALEKKSFAGSHGADSETKELADLLGLTYRSWWHHLVEAGEGDAKAVRDALKNQYPCYKDVGCFNPKTRMSLEVAGPDSPENVGTEFTFFTSSEGGGVRVTVKYWMDALAKGRWIMNRPLVAIVHGFSESGETPWIISLKDALMNYAGCNVLIVDWHKAAEFPYYFRAARDTPVPGAQLSLLIQEMIKYSSNGLSAKRVHVVGFSLGAQVAGFCGRHFHIATKKKLGRITGLDPAGPMFWNSTGLPFTR